MAFEKCKEIYKTLENASDFLEHTGVKGMKWGQNVMARDPDYIKWLQNNPSEAHVSKDNFEIGRGDDADGVDEYGAYHIDKEGEKWYDLGDGDRYYYTDGYFFNQDKPNSLPKQYDPVIGDYVEVNLPTEEETYPAPGEEEKPKEEVEVSENIKKPELPEVPDVSKDLKRHASVMKNTTEDLKKKEPTLGSKIAEGAKKAINKAKELWDKIVAKLKHGELLDEDEFDFLSHNGIDVEELITNIDDDEYLAHYGIPEQRWGVRRGPPYPLDRRDHSYAQQGAQYVKEHQNDKLSDLAKIASATGNIAGAAGAVYGTLVKPEKFPASTFSDTVKVNGKDESFADMAGRAARGESLSQEEIAALNRRQATINQFNKNYMTPQAVGRQKTLDMLQSLGAIGVSAATILSALSTIKK